jgi:O-antigen ligase
MALTSDRKPPILSSPRRPAGPLPDEMPEYTYGWLLYVGAALLALLLSFAVFKLHYAYGQAPHRIIKMLVALAVFIVVFVKPRLALHVWLLAIPLGEWLPATGIPGVNGTNLLFFVLVVTWIVPRILRGERVALRTRIGVPLAAFIAVLLFSLLRADLFPPGGVDYDGIEMLKAIWQSILGLAVYYVVVNTVASEKEVRSLLVTFGVGCTFGALIALRQFLGAGEGQRIGGALGDINDLGAYFAVCAPVLVGLVFASGAFGRMQRVLIWGSAAFASIGVLLPKSRGAIVAVACAFGVLTKLVSTKAFVVFLVILALSPLWAPGFVKDRMEETRVDSVHAQLRGDSSDELDPAAGIRLEIWGIVMSAFARSPIIGYGYGTVPYLTYGKLDRPFSAHSLYVQTAGEQGLLGLVVLFWLFAACWKSGRELLKLSDGGLERGLAAGFLAAFVALAVANVFGERFTHVSIAGTFFFLAALVDRGIHAARRGQAMERPKGELAS